MGDAVVGGLEYWRCCTALIFFSGNLHSKFEFLSDQRAPGQSVGMEAYIDLFHPSSLPSGYQGAKNLA